MGHGTDHATDICYQNIQILLDTNNINANIATVEGKTTVADILPKLTKKSNKQVHLFPFMLTVGDHALNDMAGDKNSWKTILQDNGLNPVIHLTGLGQYMRIRKIFLKHIRKGKKALFPQKYRKMKESALKKKYSIPREEIPWFPRIKNDLCNGCGLCYLFCHRDVYGYDEKSKKSIVINPYNCVVNCSHCIKFCRTGAIQFPQKTQFGEKHVSQ